MVARWPVAIRFLLGAALLALAPSAVHAQGGVIVTPEGIFKLFRFDDPTGQLHRQRVNAARAGFDQQLGRASKLRKVSLTALEAEIGKSLEANRQLTPAMLHLAGLTRVQYIFFYPETKEVVLAGPAEGWVEDGAGRTVGIDSGRPTILLEDLIVALRAYAPAARKSPTISVSIDPTKEGLRNMQQFLVRLGGNVRPTDAPMIVDGLKTNLGLQQVSIRGVSPKTHFAQVLVEADYRMKLIGIGLENPNVGITSYVAKANPAAVASNALKRWYFVPNYDCVRLSEDGMAAEMVGNGVKLVGADELVAADGTRHAAGKEDMASVGFTKSFTDKYGQLAAKVPVYAQLRNCIDLAIVAAHIRQSGFADLAGWTMPVFGSEERYAVETRNSPVQVETAVNAIWKGSRLTTPVGGGVNIQAHLALKPEHVLADTSGVLKRTHYTTHTTQPKLAPGQWWWD